MKHILTISSIFVACSPTSTPAPDCSELSGFYSGRLHMGYIEGEANLNISNDKFILSNITQYFGFKPYLREINVSVDYKYKNEADSPKFTQLFHRDPDDLKLIKVFFYLNDVNNENGPFQYVLKSHLKPWKDVEYYHNENSKRNSEKEIYTAIGKKGTMIFADTNGLHRGLVLKEKYRVMLTLMYTSNKPITGKLEKVISD